MPSYKLKVKVDVAGNMAELPLDAETLGGKTADEFALKSDIPTDYLPTSGGTINGDLTVNGGATFDNCVYANCGMVVKGESFETDTTIICGGDMDVPYGDINCSGDIYVDGTVYVNNEQVALKSDIPTDYLSTSGGTIDGNLNVGDALDVVGELRVGELVTFNGGLDVHNTGILVDAFTEVVIGESDGITIDGEQVALKSDVSNGISDAKKYTSSENHTSGFLYLIGAKEQSSAGAQTYSNIQVYVNSDGTLAANKALMTNTLKVGPMLPYLNVEGGPLCVNEEEVALKSDIPTDYVSTSGDIDLSTDKAITSVQDGTTYNLVKAVPYGVEFGNANGGTSINGHNIYGIALNSDNIKMNGNVRITGDVELDGDINSTGDVNINGVHSNGYGYNAVKVENRTMTIGDGSLSGVKLESGAITGVEVDCSIFKVSSKSEGRILEANFDEGTAMKVGNEKYPLEFYSSIRPTWNSNELALKSDIPTDYLPTSGGEINGDLNIGGRLNVNGGADFSEEVWIYDGFDLVFDGQNGTGTNISCSGLTFYSDQGDIIINKDGITVYDEPVALKSDIPTQSQLITNLGTVSANPTSESVPELDVRLTSGVYMFSYGNKTYFMNVETTNYSDGACLVDQHISHGSYGNEVIYRSIYIDASGNAVYDGGGNSTLATTSQINTAQNYASSANTSSKIYLIGATSQGAQKYTYSHDTVYVDTSGRLCGTSGIYTNKIYAPTSSGGSSYGVGSSGRVLMSNGSTCYWGSVTAPTQPQYVHTVYLSNSSIKLYVSFTFTNKWDTYGPADLAYDFGTNPFACNGYYNGYMVVKIAFTSNSSSATPSMRVVYINDAGEEATQVVTVNSTDFTCTKTEF